ncbi:L,D-transpeptidase [Cyanobium sp. CH-040]|nr:L,D-transpeptidase [Cyanobium sp. CH-040]MCP9926822.1 L,D-transpeptidase [Cyanobium sp. CH-040]
MPGAFARFWRPSLVLLLAALLPSAAGATSAHRPPSPLPYTPALRPYASPGRSAGSEKSSSRELVLDRRARLLRVLEAGQELRRFPVAVGRPGWETPVGQFQVIELVADPIWEHPATGVHVPPGPDNPLGSRWIGFHRDCEGRRGFNGVEVLTVEGCVSSGFHGTPQRDSVGRAVSHGCVRLFDEHVRELFELVQLGTPVTVLP